MTLLRHHREEIAAALTHGLGVILVTGGMLYTAGMLFYHLERLPYAHAIWHLFVLAGSICHFAAVTTQVL